MEIAPLPAGESQRLNVLHSLRLLDTEPEPAFDAVARLAGQQMGCPIGLVSLIDTDRQWFKAAQGLDVPQTPRDVAFCSHAILQDEVFVVEDATQDARFADNPLVTGAPDIRFYAGAPLTVGGHKLGALCVIDRVARQISDEDRAVLQELSLVTSSLMEARLREQRLLERVLADSELPGVRVAEGQAGSGPRLRATVFNAVSARMAVLDRHGGILETNAAWHRFAAEAGHAGGSRFIGAHYLDVLGRLRDLGPASATAARCGLASVLAGRSTGFELEYRCCRGDEPGDESLASGPQLRSDRWFAMKITPVGDEQRRIVVSHEDITKHKRAQEALLRLAHTDPLTGVANRRRFFELAHHEFERAIRYKSALTVLMADIDHFKAINDCYGHAAGDVVLRSFVGVAGEALRDPDVVGRLGGEEFAVLLPQTTLGGGHALAQRIVERVAARRVASCGGPIRYTVSVGVSTLDDRIVSFDDLLRAADDALYRAKGAGRNTVSSAFGEFC
ncbi:MAG: diguanylate cyclase [Methylibium sp.]|uniref:sensor domain-containing diguanylate cyclase n=1 Tax=Methylibium sp. TaxID=2067992 RepID=UPI00179D7D6C|nr:diguanylate cyclase [Methylibium sp.]MBA3598246.1 diguanylate cyclase [Methylibium sp.]